MFPPTNQELKYSSHPVRETTPVRTSIFSPFSKFLLRTANGRLKYPRFILNSPDRETYCFDKAISRRDPRGTFICLLQVSYCLTYILTNRTIAMADDDNNKEGTDTNAGSETQEESRHSGGNEGNKSSYRQKYKHAWELDMELRDWLTACSSDAYAAFCKFCRTKLHAHKKGLLAHAKSAKHKKHISSPHFAAGAMAQTPSHSFNNSSLQHNGDTSSPNTGDLDDSDQRGCKRNLKGHRLFNDNWLRDPSFSSWLRKVPNNNTKALCIACRCVITAGRCELIKHTRAAKHKKAIMEGPFEELAEVDLHWLETTSNQDQGFGSQSTLNIPTINLTNNQQVGIRPSVIDMPGMLVDEVLNRLNKHVPLDLAEKWDNVGIITKPTQAVKVYNILLTIDLNEKVVEEAIKKRVQFIISYHPPIFAPIKSLNPKAWKDRAILMCVEHRITVYSPHTALDAIKGGINDWLISSFLTSEEDKTRPIVHSRHKTNTSCLEVLLSESQETVAQAFKDINNVTMTEYGNSSTDVRVTCDDATLPEVVEQLAQTNYAQLCCRVTQLVAIPIPGVGMGRIVTFATPLPLYEVVQRTKTHLDLTYIRLALSPKHTRDTKVGSIAVCAGSGSSVLRGCDADVWITGEMSHHEVLDAINKGVTVILCEHSNTERGFLRDWSQQLRTSVFEDQVIVAVSEFDKEPLRFV